jgi:hypothetical protein
MDEAVATMDAEFRRLVREASHPDVTGVPLSSAAFVDAVRELEKLIRKRDDETQAGEPPLEQLREDVRRKQAVLARHAGDAARWRGELQSAVAEAEQVLLDKTQ